jgi:lysyl-tRNA synthetase class 2
MAESFRERLAEHARFSAGIRGFFSGREYLEVETPTLSPFLIPEPSLEVFRTELLSSRGGGRPMWLIPSPELWMKRLLARGSGSIFQISRSFRNGDLGGPHHNPEFRLLEWYTVGCGYLDSIATVEALIAHLLQSAGPACPRERLSPPFLRMTMAEAFNRWAGIDLAACQTPERMREAGCRQGLALPEGLTWEEAFHIAFLTLVEPNLPRDRPLALLDYPALIPTTARRKQGTPWAERWELFIDGIEIANCYTEETDAAILSEFLRLEEERKKACRVIHEIDRGLASLFPPGSPQCSGTALGVDRLEMAFAGAPSLEGVILFPISAILGRESDPG